MPIGMEVGSAQHPLNFRPMFIIVIVISLLSVEVQVLVSYSMHSIFREKV